MKKMEKTTIEKPRSKSRNQIRKEVGRGLNTDMKDCTDIRTAVMGGQARIGKCSNLAFISFIHALHLFIYCVHLIVIQLFYIYAFHSDCVSSHIIEQMLSMYAQTDHAK